MKTLQVLAGFAETDITPEQLDEFELIGFNRANNQPKGVLHPLKAQAMVLQTKTLTGCLITIDSIGITTPLTNQMRDQIAGLLHCSRENVMVCYSHTHSAPDAAANDGRYYQFMLPKIMKAVSDARKAMFPIKAAWGVAENTIGINRRNVAAAMDKRLGVLKIANALTDKTELLLLRVTAHPNVLTADNYLISSDYFGVTRDLLEKQYDCKVLITQGAAGNIRSRFRQHNADSLEEDPLQAQKKLTSREKQELFAESMAALQRNAQEISHAVATIFGDLRPKDIYRLKLFSRTQEFVAALPTLKRACEIMKEAEVKAGIPGNDWFNEVKQLQAAGIPQQSVLREIQFFLLNEGCLCGVPDEPMCEIALAAQHKAQDDLLFFGGYTNGYEGYLPNNLEYDRGGYEVLWSNLFYYQFYQRLMPFNRDTADKLSSFIADVWRKEK